MCANGQGGSNPNYAAALGSVPQPRYGAPTGGVAPVPVVGAPGFNPTGPTGLGGANLGNVPGPSPTGPGLGAGGAAPISGGYGSNAGGTYSADPATGAGDWAGAAPTPAVGTTNYATGGIPSAPAPNPGGWSAGAGHYGSIDDRVAAQNRALQISAQSNPAYAMNKDYFDQSIAKRLARSQGRWEDQAAREAGRVRNGPDAMAAGGQRAGGLLGGMGGMPDRAAIQANQQQYQQQLMASGDPSRIAPYMMSMYGDKAPGMMDQASRQFALSQAQEELAKAQKFAAQTGSDQTGEIARLQQVIDLYSNYSDATAR